MMKKLLSMAAIGLISMMCIAGCSKKDNAVTSNPDDVMPEYLKVMTPKAGQVINKGETVVVTVKCNPDKVSTFGLKLSIDNGLTYDDLNNITFKPGDSYTWVVGEGLTAPLFSKTGTITSCMIKAYVYGSPKMDATGSFTVVIK